MNGKWRFQLKLFMPEALNELSLSKYSKCPNVVTAKNLKIDMILPEKESISPPLKEDAKQKCSCVKKNGD